MRRYLLITLFSFFVALTAILLALDLTAPSPSSEPTYFVFIFNVIFIVIMGLAVSFLSARSYLSTGQLNLLILGSAVLLLVFASFIAGLGLWITRSSNVFVTIHNCLVLAAGTLFFLGSFMSFEGLTIGNTSNLKAKLSSGYIAVAIFSMLTVFLVENELTPVFFIVGTGSTTVRYWVLACTVFLFGISSLLLTMVYLKSKSRLLYWYSGALGMLAVGFFIIIFAKYNSGALVWTGRAAQYVGSVFFLFAALHSARFSGDSWAEAFRSDRSQMSSLLANLTNGVAYAKVISDETGKPIDFIYLDVNDAFEKNSGGLKRENVLGKRATEVFPGIDNDPDWIDNCGRVALTGEAVAVDRYSKVMNKWYHTSLYSPQKGYFVSISEDITERRKAEKEIESLAKFPLENPAVVLRVDQKGILLFANPTAHNFLNEWQIEVGGGVPQNVKQMVIDSLALGSKIEFEENLGEEIFSFLVAPIVAEGYANLYGRSITKRKKAEEELRQSKIWEATSVYTRNLIEASLDPLVTISAEGKITDVNKATENATGCSREELIGSDFSKYFAEPEKAAAGYKQVFIQGVVRDYPLAIRHKTGKVTEVLYNASLYRNAKGQVQGVFAAARDITERKILEKQLQERERLAAIGATAGMVGHDIRNPLQSIAGDVYLVKSDLESMPEGEAKENIKVSLDGIEKSLGYIDKIVSDLQDYAKALKPVAQETDLEDLIEELMLKTAIPKNVKISSKVMKTARNVIADPTIIRRILGNLVSNALQAMPNGGELTINAYEQAGDIVITVQDTGIGIPEDIKPKVFTPLFTTKSKGQGFGLAVVKRMTEALGGTVSFESEQGKGTKFIVRFIPPKK